MKHETKTILCYGDSNTWGAVPNTNDRYPLSVRWPGALQSLLGPKYEVISEGLCGRTLAAADPKKPHRTGITHFRAIVESADPVEVLFIMLGTNDMKSTYNLSAPEIAEHLNQTLLSLPAFDIVKIPHICVVCPPAVIQNKENNLDERMVRAIEISKTLPEEYKKVADRHQVHFINAGDYVKSSDLDGYHLDAETHIKLSQVFADFVKRLS